MRVTSPPAALVGYRMPAEWERHEATWIAWPHNREDWPGKFQPIPWIYAEIVRHIATGERVRIVVNDRAHQHAAGRTLKQAGVELTAVEFFSFPTDRVWTRDSGPIFVVGTKGQPTTILHWQFNGWAKYNNFKKDEKLPQRIAQKLQLPVLAPEIFVGEKRRRMVLEGGSIDVNGTGTLITTEECLLSKVQARNPGATRDAIETAFRDYLGVTNTIWLGCGIAGDDTHGHVDDIARFVSPDTVVAAVEPDPSDANHQPLEENLNRLRKATDERGRPLKILELPLPSPVWFRGQRLPASYANFYIANTVVLVPTFNHENDRHALNLLASVYPNRKVVGIYCGDFIWGLGAIHCATQQQPTGT